MKKFIFLVVTVLFIVSLISCGADTKRAKNDDESGNDEVEQSDDDGESSENDNETRNDDEQEDEITKNDEDNSDAVCGNNVTESGEECDGNVVDCTDIDDQKYKGGKARCKNDCSGFDDITCEMSDNYCGDGKAVYPEVCDGWSVSCVSVDSELYSGGDAPCKDDCTGYDVSSCIIIEAKCGDGKVEGSEVCEEGELEDCVNIDSSTFDGGKARCKKDCTGWDTVTCEEKSGGLFSDGFENGDSKWDLTGDFLVGTPNYDLHGVTIDVAESGTKVLATIPDGNYNDSLISTAFTSSKITLPPTGTYVLKFQAFVNTDFDSDGTTGAFTYYDGMRVVYKFGDEEPAELGVTCDKPELVGTFKGYEGTTYTDYEGVRGASFNNTYSLFSVDLSSLAGNSIYLGFEFYSDTMQGGEGSFPGVYLDDVEIVEE